MPESAPRGGGSALGGLLLGGVCSGAVSAQTRPPVNRITDTSKNITLATTSLRPVTRRHFNRLSTARLTDHSGYIVNKLEYVRSGLMLGSGVPFMASGMGRAEALYEDPLLWTEWQTLTTKTLPSRNFVGGDKIPKTTCRFLSLITC